MEDMCSTARALCSWPVIVLWSSAVLVSGRHLVERDTSYGKVRGFVEKLKTGQKVEKYLGVPYAKPPVGELRFEPPAPQEKWQGMKNTLELPPACPQTRSGVEYIQFHVPDFNKTSEDCLYLNIFVPRSYRHHKRYVTDNKSYRSHAVIVFVHGGSYMYGMGAMMDGSHLAAHDVIVITFNYRLGPLGFLESQDDLLPGNYGLLDQVAALRWVQENIHHFGGDPSRVTIDGHSAGGCSVGLLMLMPIAKGLFTRVIQQSGSPFANWAVSRQPDNPNFFFKLFTSASGCYGNGTPEVKACLKKASSEKIQTVIDDLIMHPVSMAPPYRPVVDGLVIPDTPEKLAVHGHINGHEILTGTTTGEGLEAAYILSNTIGKDHHGLQRLMAVMNGFRVDLPDIRSLVEIVLEQYYRWPYDLDDSEINEGLAEIVGDYFIAAPTHLTAELLSSRNVAVYVYNFDYFSSFDHWKGARHGVELFYLSGYPLSGHDNFGYDETDRVMATTLMQMWANFAQTGLPTLAPHRDYHIPPYTVSQPSYTQIKGSDGQVSMSTESSFKQHKMAFWNHYVPSLYINQLSRDVHLLGDSLRFDLKSSTTQSISSRSAISTAKDAVQKLSACSKRNISDNWILIAACVGLCFLTVLLSVCYCHVKRQVKTLIRQTSISSGEPIL